MCTNPFLDMEEDLDLALLDLWDKYVEFGKVTSGEESFVSSVSSFVGDIEGRLLELLKEG